MRPGPSRILAFAALALVACSNPEPPQGRWEGIYDGPQLIVAVRLEIAPNGDVRVSAPNAFTKDEDLSKADRADIRKKLVDGLEKSWPSVAKAQLEFDGKAFHKPGGVAPQLEWDAKSQKMTMIYYSGRIASIRVPLMAVQEFSPQS